MTCVLMPGPYKWSMTRDNEGHREYKIAHRVRSDDLSDGPANAIRCAGLPTPGSTWNFYSDTDPYAYCKLDATVTPQIDDQKQPFFLVEQTFSTKPDRKSCKEEQFENPLLQPMKVSGSFVKFTEEATHDRFGYRIRNSAWEMIRGQQNEWDANRPQVKIEQNLLHLELDLFSQMIDTVNQYELWGLPPRTIKLSNVPWTANFYGTCLTYYTRTLEFDVRYRRVFGISSEVNFGTGTLNPVSLGSYETFDRDLLDEGTKCLRGHWNHSGVWVTEKYDVLPSPNTPSIAVSPTGGFLAAGTVAYRVSAYNGVGETVPGAPARATLTGSTSQVVIDWPAVTGATGYKVYKLDSNVAGGYGLVYTGTNQFYQDTGTVIPGNPPPGVNSTGTQPDRNNPSHFIRFTDVNGNVARVILDGLGLPAYAASGTGTGTGLQPAGSAGSIHVEKYGESDFLLLGVPPVLYT